MALLFQRRLNDTTALAVWKIDETISELLSLHPFLKPFYDSHLAQIRNGEYQLEKLAVYCLLWQLSGKVITIAHDQNGRPMVEGYEISVSHTKGYAAIILSTYHRVGIDIEYMSERIHRVASRFMRFDESALTTKERLLTWCAKETLYKFDSAYHLSSDEMRVLDINLESLSEGAISIEQLKYHQLYDVYYVIASDFVLTWMVE